MFDMQALVDRLELQDVMLRYARGADDRNFELYRSCFMQGAEIINFAAVTLHDIDDFLVFVEGALSVYSTTQHLLAPSLIVIDGDRAHADTEVQASHCLKEPAGEVVVLWATYDTDFVRHHGVWKICRHRLVIKAARDASGQVIHSASAAELGKWKTD